MTSTRLTRKHATHFIEALETRRLLSAGGLDLSFSGDGKASVNFGPLTVFLNAMAVQSNGKIVEVGEASDGQLALARLNADGSPDTTFGPSHSGVLVTAYAGSTDVQARAVAIQPDGKIVVAASRNFHTFDVLRFNPDGSFDKTFDSDGIVNVDVGFNTNGDPAALAIQQDGKIVVVGGDVEIDADFFIARLNANGSLDRSFGDVLVSAPGLPTVRSGTTTVDYNGFEGATAVTIDYHGTAADNPDFGHIVVVGDQTVFGDGNIVASKIGLARFNTNGTLDKSFNGTGKRLITIAGENYADASGVVIEPAGQIVVGGTIAPTPNSPKQFLLMGLTSAGANNSLFGSNGVVTTSFNAGSSHAHAIVNGFTQDIILGGNAGDQFALAAYSVNGKLDPAFGIGGKVTTPGFAGTSHVIEALALGPNRTIVAAGEDAFQTARYFDIGPSVAVTAIIKTASEKGPQPETFVVTRDLRLPFPTRVYFTIGGTATSPTALAVKDHSNDYTLSGMTILPTLHLGENPHPYVDIPADQTSTLVTLTPVDDKIIEGTETASFSIVPDPLYDQGTPASATISILDDAKTLKPTADAHVNDGGNANLNFGTAGQIKVKTGSSGQNRVAFLKFDLTGITSVNSVQLQLFGELSAASTGGVVTQIFAVPNTTWSETGITFNNKPAPTGSALASATILDTTPRLYTFDLTAFIKSQLALGTKVITLELKNPAARTPIVLFNSREAASNGPQLLMT
ncbi:MAG TPA: DNRLRE domain-containing protein [Humisphaera sp.]|jgi:uncharacterized delta-60 repeat protein|nr:DNRLRE domain-containing protein [Humisphaera sp.]